MSEIERDPQAVRTYERMRDAVAERRVVDEAEKVLGRAWLDELEDIRKAALGVVAAIRLATNIALSQLRRAQGEGRLAEMARAQARLAALESKQGIGLDEAHAVLDWVDTELEKVDTTDLERRCRIQHDLEQLRAAWTAAFGISPGDRTG